MEGQTVEPNLLILILAGMALGVVAVLFLWRWREGGTARTEAAEAGREDRLLAAVGQLAGRLDQLSSSSAASQSQLAERLQAQEREVRKTLEERLAEVTKRLTDGLEKTATQTTTTIGDLRERIVRIDEAQKNIAKLSDQVVSLQDILANKQAQGAFGQIQLEDLVKKVLPPSAYGFQAPLGEGRRADCLLQLPNPPGPIAIDAKFPLDTYHGLRTAADETAKKEAARAFRNAMSGHIRDVAEKYIVPGETAESALLFLPSEAIYAEVHANFPDVVEKSYRARVFIVSPTTLWATLNTVRAVLKDVRMREQAGLIQKEVLTLVEDVGRLDERVGNLQRHFEQASDDMRHIRISSEKITKRAEKIEEVRLEEEGKKGPAEVVEVKRPALGSAAEPTDRSDRSAAE